MNYTLVTGATGGLGKEFCRALIKTDDLFLTGRSGEKLENLKAELLEINPSANICRRYNEQRRSAVAFRLRRRSRR